MSTPEIIAQILGIVVMIWVVIFTQFKKMKAILIAELIANGLVMANYALLGGLSGSFVCIWAIIQTVCVYCYTSRDKEFPKPFLLVFMLGYLALALYSFFSVTEYPSSAVIKFLIRLLDPNGEKPGLPRLLYGISVALSFAAAILFALSVSEKDSRVFRRFTFLNAICWILYDVYTGAYTTILTHGFLAVSALVAIYRYDRKKAGETAAESAERETPVTD